MRIIQLLPTLSFGDAVGNDTISLNSVIKEMGYKTQIYAENIDNRLPKNLAKSKITEIKEDDIIIYHKAIGTDISFSLDKFNCKKIMIYHNITPPKFFKAYDMKLMELTEYGLKGVKYLSDKVDYCLADSEFNKQNLIDMGYKCKIDVRSILIPFNDYKKEPNYEIINKYNDDWVNIIFVGRIAPNKKQEDIIKPFYYYKKYINSKSRLFIVGSYQGMESYYNRLKNYVDELDLQDVYFTGHVKFNEILSYYKLADIFLCMSEHEGFCVPLVEAMYFNIPIIAYNSSAIPYTLGGSGILINEKDPIVVAKLIDRIIYDVNLKETIINKQKEQLKDFSYNVVKNQFEVYLEDFIKQI